MKTKVILQDDIPNLGVSGDVKDVAPGYARNYLLPRNSPCRRAPVPGPCGTPGRRKWKRNEKQSSGRPRTRASTSRRGDHDLLPRGTRWKIVWVCDDHRRGQGAFGQGGCHRSPLGGTAGPDPNHRRIHRSRAAPSPSARGLQDPHPAGGVTPSGWRPSWLPSPLRFWACAHRRRPPAPKPGGRSRCIGEHAGGARVADQSARRSSRRRFLRRKPPANFFRHPLPP
jgi:hypothetical protein